MHCYVIFLLIFIGSLSAQKQANCGYITKSKNGEKYINKIIIFSHNCVCCFSDMRNANKSVGEK